MQTFINTIISVVVAVVASGGIFFGANAIIDGGAKRWGVATGGLGGVLGLLAGAIMQHNGLLKWGGDVWGPLKDGWLGILIGGIVGAAIGYALGTAREPDLATKQRSEHRWRPVVFVGPAIAFVLMGLVFPSLKTLIISFRGGKRGEGGASLEHYRDIFGDDQFFNLESFDRIFTSRLFIVGVAAVLIALLAAFASTREILDTGEARTVRTVMKALGWAGAVLGVLVVVGFFEGVARDPNQSWIFDNILTPLVQSRVSLWVVVAAFFGFAAWYLTSRSAEAKSYALLSERGASMVGYAVVAAVVALAVVLGLADTISLAESVSLALAALGIGALWLMNATNKQVSDLDFGSPTASLSFVFAAIMVLLAVFSTLQSVLWNNLWWVATVTGFSTVFGLMLAILADRAKGEKAARTLIFLPMAISMVGAAVIWDFVFELQPFGNQTGLLNAFIEWLGFKPRGFFVNSTMIPWNNFWIMIIMVWIQTGFAMVILSAAIKGVPDELLEAARVDGANEVQAFWRVIMPQIRTTIVVVITTLIIIVMKVFDLVKATTGGANRTNVLANEMFDQLRVNNFALSSAFAVVIFGLVLPVMIYNVRSNLKELS